MNTLFHFGAAGLSFMMIGLVLNEVFTVIQFVWKQQEAEKGAKK